MGERDLRKPQSTSDGATAVTRVRIYRNEQIKSIAATSIKTQTNFCILSDQQQSTIVRKRKTVVYNRPNLIVTCNNKSNNCCTSNNNCTLSSSPTPSSLYNSISAAGDITFPCVEKLVKNYSLMIQQKSQSNTINEKTSSSSSSPRILSDLIGAKNQRGTTTNRSNNSNSNISDDDNHNYSCVVVHDNNNDEVDDGATKTVVISAATITNNVHRGTINSNSATGTFNDCCTSHPTTSRQNIRNSPTAETVTNKSSAMSSKYYSKNNRSRTDCSDNSEGATNTVVSIKINKPVTIDHLTIDQDRFNLNNSPLSDEGCLANASPYSSSSEDEVEQLTADVQQSKNTVHHLDCREKVTRSFSSDSALGLDDEINSEHQPSSGENLGRRLTLTVDDIPLRPALLPLACPKSLPDSPTGSMIPIVSIAVPSKVLLEGQLVEIPSNIAEKHTKPKTSWSSFGHHDQPTDMRRVSYHGDESADQRRRYVRTPSVVVSDYSDDCMLNSITLDDIEFFRSQRSTVRRRSSLQDNAINPYMSFLNQPLSAASSCSNFNFCGSTISDLDTLCDDMFGPDAVPQRKISDCSTCSIISVDEDPLAALDKKKVSDI